MKSQLVPRQVGVALAGVAQVAHPAPQLRKPDWQLSAHWPAEQLAVPLGSVVHAEHEVPQLLTEVSERHWLPQR